MTKKASSPSKKEKSWFAPRQVYLRTDQGSTYVELSRRLQVSVAAGFGLLALWLLFSAYGMLFSGADGSTNRELAAKLNAAELELTSLSDQASKVIPLETALAEVRSALAEAQQVDETTALIAELEQTKGQLEDLRQQVSESKAAEATLQAKLDAQVAAGQNIDEKPAEEASSLHTQLEEAYAEIEGLEEARDGAVAKLAAVTAERSSANENSDQKDAMLTAATQEIERLQTIVAKSQTANQDQEVGHEEEINRLSALLADEQSTNRELQNTLAELEGQLHDREAAAGEQDQAIAETAKRYQSEAIDAQRREAELATLVEDLQAQLETQLQPAADAGELDRVKAELALANEEVEKLLKNMLSQPPNGVDTVPQESAAAVIAATANDSEEEVEALRAELSTAKGEIIKLRSDIRAAKQRLAAQDDSQPTISGDPDRSAKLEQQLASTRSRIQQLNKALSDAKLREVAIDLALINVVPLPSPPAPR